MTASAEGKTGNLPEAGGGKRGRGEGRVGAELHGFELVRLVPASLEIAVAPRDCCGDAEIAADEQRCQAAVQAAQAASDALRTRFVALRAAAYEQRLACSGYETAINRFEARLKGFFAALAAYEDELVGRTYTTSALSAEADDLDQLRNGLSSERSGLVDRFQHLQDEARRLRESKDGLLADIQAEIDQLEALLKTFICKDCSRLRPLIERLKSLRRDTNSIRISDPSPFPSAIPWVPKLPPPPWSSSQGALPHHAHPPHISVRVLITGMPPLTDIPQVIYAGDVFPNTIPIEGAPRLCVGQVWWLYRMRYVDPGHVLRQIDEGTRGPAFQFLFQRTPPPRVEVEGGLDATDVYVSQDRTKVYFTLYRPGDTSNVAEANITIHDASGKTIQIHSNDPDDTPSPTLHFASELDKGVAGLLASLAFIAVDAACDPLQAGTSPAADALAETLRTNSGIYTEILDRIQQRGRAASQDDWTKTLWPPDYPLADPVLPMNGETRPSGGVLGHLFADVPAWYDGLMNSRTSGSRLVSGLFSDRPAMVLNRLEQWGEVLSLPSL